MRYTMALCMLAAILFPAAAAGDWYEDFDDGLLTGWTIVNPYVWGDDPVTIEASMDEWLSPIYSLKISGLEEHYVSGRATGPNPGIDVNQTYTIEFDFRYSDVHWYYLVAFEGVQLTIDKPSLRLKYWDDRNPAHHSLPDSPSFSSYCPADTWTHFEIVVYPYKEMYTVYADGVQIGSALYQTFNSGSHGFRVTEQGGQAPCEPDFISNGHYDNIAIYQGCPQTGSAPPVAANDHYSLGPSETETLFVLDNDASCTDTLIVSSLLTSGMLGSASIGPGDSTIIYTAPALPHFTDSFQYVVSDLSGQSATAYVTILGPSTPPVAVDDFDVTDEDVAVELWPLLNDHDPDGDPIVVSSAVVLTGGGRATISQDDQSILYEPGANFFGQARLLYRVRDPFWKEAAATITVDVAPIPDPPKAFPDVLDVHRDVARVLYPLRNDKEYDGDPLFLIGLDTMATLGLVSIDPGDSTVSYIPPPDYEGEDWFSYEISDGVDGTDIGYCHVFVTSPDPDSSFVNIVVCPVGDGGASVQVVDWAGFVWPDVEVTVDLSNPVLMDSLLWCSDTVLTAWSDSTDAEGVAVIPIDLAGTAWDGAQVYVDWGVGPEPLGVTYPVAGLDLNRDGTVNDADADIMAPFLMLGIYDPRMDYNGDGQGTGVTDGAIFTYHYNLQHSCANPAPVAVDDTVTCPVDEAITVHALGNDYDPEGDPLVLTEVENYGYGWAEIDPGDTTITYYSPGYWGPPSYEGPDSFHYQVNDGRGHWEWATVQVTVGPVGNQPPNAAADHAETDVDVPVTVFVLANDTDPDGDPLTVSALVLDLTDGSAEIDAGDTTVTYTPPPGFAGADTLDYVASDGNGGLDTARVTITVWEAGNRRPVAVNDTTVTAEDQFVTVPVLINDTDPDGDPLFIAGLISQATLGQAVVDAGDTTTTYTPPLNFHGTDAYDYVVTDGNGGIDTATVLVTVTPVNDPPVAVDDEAEAEMNVPVAVLVLANDVDVDGDALTVGAVLTGATLGEAAIDAGDTTVTYTPPEDFAGVDTFLYVADDGNGGLDTATVTVAVIEPNLAPLALDDVAAALIDAELRVHVLANDSDPNQDTLQVVSLDLALTSGFAEIDTLGLTVVYTPPPGFSGFDTFGYTITDGRGEFDDATVTVSVTGPPDPAHSTWCLVACLAGEETSTIAVRDSSDLPIMGAAVRLDLSGPEPQTELNFCGLAGVPDILAATDLSGNAALELRCGGGVTGGIRVTAFFRGVEHELAASASMAAYDLDADLQMTPADFMLFQERFATMDPRVDYNCDGIASILDVAKFTPHLQAGHSCVVTGIADDRSFDPMRPVLAAPRPNPFTASITLAYTLPEAGPVALTVHDILGRRVAVLEAGWLSEGVHAAVWDGRDTHGVALPSGIYFVRLGAGDVVQTRKFVRIR